MKIEAILLSNRLTAGKIYVPKKLRGLLRCKKTSSGTRLTV
jgi:hypothetical protein